MGNQAKKERAYRIILIRHSKAEAASLIDDFNRELVPQGRKKTQKATQKINEKKYSITKIITSPAIRALQTAEIISENTGNKNKLQIEEELYLAKSEDILSIINKIKPQEKGEDETILIIGHEPTISESAYKLINSASKETKTIEAKKTLRFGLATANYVTLKSTTPFPEWKFGEINKARITLVD